MLFRPVNDNQSSNKNNWWSYSQNAFFGTEDANGKQSFLFDVLDARHNAKTDETARKAYYYIDPTNATATTQRPTKQPARHTITSTRRMPPPSMAKYHNLSQSL